MSLLFRFSAFVAAAIALVGALSAAPQLGLQSWTLREMNFEEAVLFAKQHGITQVEFFKKHIDPAAAPEVNAVKRAFLAEHGVTAYSLGVSGTSMDEAENRKLFETAKAFGMKVIVVEPKDPAEWDMLEALVKEYDIRLAIHNHGTGTTYGNPAVVKHILAERDHRIGVCMDVGWITAAGFDAESTFLNYGDRVFDLHLKDKRLDVLIGKDRPADTFIGLGNANYAGLFRAIRDTDWSGVMAIETDSAEFAANPHAFVAAAKEFFERSVLVK